MTEGALGGQVSMLTAPTDWQNLGYNRIVMIILLGKPGKILLAGQDWVAGGVQGPKFQAITMTRFRSLGGFLQI